MQCYQMQILGGALLFGAMLAASTPKATAETRSLSLDAAIARAVEVNPAVEQARAELDAATERKRAAWSNVGPKIVAQYAETHYEEEIGAGPGLPPQRTEIMKMGSLELKQPITGLYGYIQAGRFSGLQKDVSYESLRQTKRDVGFQAAEAFLNAYQAQEQDQIAETSLKASRRQFDDALAIQRVGRLSRGDVLKFQLALSQAESRAAQARSNKQVAFAALKLVLQYKDEEGIQLAANLPEPKGEPMDINRGISEALQKKPEARKALYASELADYGKDLAYAQYIPWIEIFKKRDYNFGDPIVSFREKSQDYYGVRLNWEIWSSGSSFFAVREAYANKQKADALKTAAEDSVKLEVIQSWQFYQAAKQSLKFAETGVTQAEEAYRIDQTRFKNGQISATDLIISENAKSSAQGNKVTAETQYLLWHFRLQRSVGKDLPQAS